MKNTMTFKQFVHFLRTKMPTPIPVKVRRTKMPLDKKRFPAEREFGDISDCEDHFIIRINKHDPLRIQKDTLIHEWAHCFEPFKDNTEHHSDKWGRIYARIYRICVG